MESENKVEAMNWETLSTGKLVKIFNERYGAEVNRSNIMDFEAEHGIKLMFDPKTLGPKIGNARGARYILTPGYTDASTRVRVKITGNKSRPMKMGPSARASKNAPSTSLQIVKPVAQIPAETVDPVSDKVVQLARVGASPVFIPTVDPVYAPINEAANYTGKIIKSGRFTTVMVTGPTGCGKTFSVEQSCAKYKRPLVKFSVTTEVSESTLFGDFRLVDGNMAWYDGPVVTAMRQGAVLLLDELPKADPDRIMALQEVLVGNPYIIKKTGEVITPAPGFQVIATGNSRGNGDQTGGLYLTDRVLDEAFKERFQITIDSEYPTPAHERKLLARYGCDEEFADILTKWAAAVRESVKAGASECNITTRRLIHIIANMEIFGDRETAIKLALNRFEPAQSEALLTTYKMFDGTTPPKKKEETAESNDDVMF